MKNKITTIRIIITMLLAVFFYYFWLPPINLSSPSFWAYVIFIALIYIFSATAKLLNLKDLILSRDKRHKFLTLGISVLSICGLIILMTLINFLLSPIFNSKTYYNRINVNEEGNFTEDVEQVDFNALPLLDKDSSQKLGDRVMGQMPELVSQFDVSYLYTQINYNNSIIRVTPLEYNGFIKYLTNRKGGVKGYITVNSVTGESKLEKLDQGMKYMPSACFFENLYRKLRLSYPTEIFGEENFEIDNEGHPYWIIPTIKYKGIGILKDISGIIILDPITGESKKYSVDEVPTWVDHVYSADLIIEQVNDWGQYKNGFLNSIFGQKNVVQTTEGYNYTVMNDDVYLYTGITSKVSDEANIGFILANLRTKETIFYSVPGAEEYSAMASAEGQVQQMNYIASFPLLINLNDKPTYLISLKDNAGLVKMYALVDVEDYQKVVVTESSAGIQKAVENYLGSETIKIDTNNLLSKNITISTIKDVVIDGTSYYYITDIDGKKYKASIKTASDIVPFLSENDVLNIYYNVENDVTEIVRLQK